MASVGHCVPACYQGLSQFQWPVHEAIRYIQLVESLLKLVPKICLKGWELEGDQREVVRHPREWGLGEDQWEVVVLLDLERRSRKWELEGDQWEEGSLAGNPNKVYLAQTFKTLSTKKDATTRRSSLILKMPSTQSARWSSSAVMTSWRYCRPTQTSSMSPLKTLVP